MKAIMVKKDEAGAYEIPGAAETEDWADVCASVGGVEFVEALKGWGEWKAAHRVMLANGAPDMFYFVADDE